MKQKTNPTKLILHFDDESKQVITPSEEFSKEANKKTNLWKELAEAIIGTRKCKEYQLA